MSLQVPIDPALKAAGFIGVWNTNVPAASSILDAGAAEVLAGDIGLAGRPLPLEVALGRTHPDDRDWVFERIRRVRRTGGPVSAEIRVLTGTGAVRWVLIRGNLTLDEGGTMRGRGAYIDTTEHRSSAFPADRPIEIPEADPLVIAADRSLEAHTAIVRAGHRKLRQLSDLMLLELGQLLARRMGG